MPSLDPPDLAFTIALYRPEIPGNVGAVLRLSACFGVKVALVEPCGFPFSDKRVRRAGMDYIDHVTLDRFGDWNALRGATPGRIVLLTTRATTRLHDFSFERGDTLLMGQESAGVPDDVRAACDASVRIPLSVHVRSLNVSVAAGIAIAEALRQTGGLPT